jgi:hypothetical protein
MELRHLRYFVAVAETGSLTVAAERERSGWRRGDLFTYTPLTL